MTALTDPSSVDPQAIADALLGDLDTRRRTFQGLANCFRETTELRAQLAEKEAEYIAYIDAARKLGVDDSSLRAAGLTLPAKTPAGRGGKGSPKTSGGKGQGVRRPAAKQNADAAQNGGHHTAEQGENHDADHQHGEQAA